MNREPGPPRSAEVPAGSTADLFARLLLFSFVGFIGSGLAFLALAGWETPPFSAIFASWGYAAGGGAGLIIRSLIVALIGGGIGGFVGLVSWGLARKTRETPSQ